MYEEDLVLDFLTIKQVGTLIFGLFLSVVSYVYFASSEYPFVIPVVFLVLTVAVMARFKPHRIANPEEYLMRHPEKRASFIKKLKRKEAYVVDLQKRRMIRGMIQDPKLDTAITNLRSLIEKIERMP